MRRRWLAALAFVLAIAAILPALAPHPFVLGIVTQALIWALLAVSWDFISGYTGQISFGHAPPAPIRVRCAMAAAAIA